MSDESGTSETAGKALGDFQAIGDAARQAGQQAQQAGSDALHQARDVAQDAQARAASVLESVGEQAGSVAETQKSSLADTLEDLAKAVHRSGEQLEGHQDWAASVIERGAAELSVLANTLRNNDLQSLLGDLGSLARRQPALYVGASIAAGFALTRVGRVAVSGTSTSTGSNQSSSNSPSASVSSSASGSASHPEVTDE